MGVDLPNPHKMLEDLHGAPSHRVRGGDENGQARSQEAQVADRNAPAVHHYQAAKGRSQANGATVIVFKIVIAFLKLTTRHSLPPKGGRHGAGLDPATRRDIHP